MPEPIFSNYKDLYDSLPVEFKEEVILVKRFQTGTDDYGKPEFQEVEVPLIARVDVQEVADRTAEIGGIRETGLAKVFLKIPERIVDDEFDYVGVPDPAKWIIDSGNPTVDGEKLIIPGDPSNHSITSIIEAVYYYVAAYLSKGGASGAGLTLWDPIFPSDQLAISITGDNQVDCSSVVQGIGSEFDQVPISMGSVVLLEIYWFEGKAYYFVDGTIVAEHSAPYITDKNCQVRLQGNNFGDVYVYWVQSSGVNVGQNDQFEIRGKRYAIMDDILMTHLQVEINLQVVIPNG